MSTMIIYLTGVTKSLSLFSANDTAVCDVSKVEREHLCKAQKSQ